MLSRDGPYQLHQLLSGRRARTLRIVASVTTTSRSISYVRPEWLAHFIKPRICERWPGFLNASSCSRYRRRYELFLMLIHSYRPD